MGRPCGGTHSTTTATDSHVAVATLRFDTVTVKEHDPARSGTVDRTAH